MPVAVQARQPGDLGDQDDADLAQTDRRNQALEAETLLATGSRQAEIIIDDADVGVRPAHLPCPLDQLVLAAGALLVVEHVNVAEAQPWSGWFVVVEVL